MNIGVWQNIYGVCAWWNYGACVPTVTHKFSLDLFILLVSGLFGEANFLIALCCDR